MEIEICFNHIVYGNLIAGMCEAILFKEVEETLHRKKI